MIKVDPASLPRRPNLHYLGQKSYGELPGYLKAFDVCLMPWALNDATKTISPTKTLEYMAGGKPIVSTRRARRRSRPRRPRLHRERDPRVRARWP